MDNIIGGAFAVRDEYPKEEKENREFGGKNNRVVDDFDDVCQLMTYRISDVGERP